MIVVCLHRFGLAARPWSTDWRGISPPFLLSGRRRGRGRARDVAERILSIFIDESGDFGAYDRRAPYYLVTMVLHDQDCDISGNIRALNDCVSRLGYPFHAIHTGPLIRRESVYAGDLMTARKSLFNALFNFARRLDFQYICLPLRKGEAMCGEALMSKLARLLDEKLQSMQDFFARYGRVIVYYDNGQVELTRVLKNVFGNFYIDAEFRRVKPSDYKLFQVADLMCTLELLSLKADSGSFSNSEKEFFTSVRDFKKNYLKPALKKKS